MGQCEGEIFGNSSSNNFSNSSCKFYTIANKCAYFSAAAVAAAAAYTAAISSTTCTTTSTTIAKLGADTNSTGQTTARISRKNVGQCIIKRGWWSREVLLSPGDAIFQSGIPSVGWWKLWGKVATTHGWKGSPSCTAWSETYDAQHARACLDGTQWPRSPTFRLWAWKRKNRCLQWRTRTWIWGRTST